MFRLAAGKTEEGPVGLKDKAKGFLKDHEAQIQSATDKAKQAVNKTSDSMNQRVSGRLPNTGTTTPYGQASPDAQIEEEEAAGGSVEQESMTDGSSAQMATARSDQPQARPPPPPGPPMPG
jgi:hypothetical protein